MSKVILCDCITCSERWPETMPIYAREAVLALIERTSPGPIAEKLAATLTSDFRPAATA